MSAAPRKGLIIALLHVLLVGTLGAKLLVDRAVLPRVWVRTAPIDPNLPIRGRYVRLQIEIEPARNFAPPPSPAWDRVALWVEGDRLIAYPSADARLSTRVATREGQPVLVLRQPLAYFIPEQVPDPSLRPPGEELWVDVTVPRRGAPRPIRLGVMKNGVLTPLDLR